MEWKKVFLSVYEPVMSDMGFKRKGVIFHRLVNEKIIQLLSYTKFSYGSFTIQFDIGAICSGMEYTTFMDDCRLGSLLGNETYAEWDNDGTGYVTQMRESLAICREHLFPYFDSMVDYKSYISGKQQMYKAMYRCVSDAYKEIHGDPSENYIRGSDVYAISLLNGDYETAKKSREIVIAQNEDALKSMTLTPPPKRIQDFENLCREYNRMKEAMDSNDREFIEAYVKRQEEYSLESYIKNFYGKKALKAYHQNKQCPL